MKCSVFLTALLAVLPAAALAQPIDLAAFNHLVGLSSPVFSPGGRRIGFIKTVTDMARDKHLHTLMLVGITGGAPRALTAPHEDLSSPQWSPSGKAIAYLEKGDNKKDQIFVVSASGAGAREITQTKNGVEQFSWSPDGKQFAYVTPDGRPNAAAIKRGDNLFTIHDDGYRITAPPRPSHIWLIASGGGRARQLTHGSWSVLEAAPPFVGAPSNPSWSENGRQIAFTRQADADNSDTDRTKIAVVDVRSGALHMLTAHPKYEYQPSFAPSGNSVAYIYPHGPGPLSAMNLFVGAADISSRLDRDITAFAWMPDGKSLVVLANDRTRVGLWQLSLHGTAQRIDLGQLNPDEFDIGKSGAIAFTASTATTPPELYVLRSPGGIPRKLTALNARFATYRYGRTSEFAWSASDGVRSDGVVTYPVGYVTGHIYPLVVYIHGGPEAASSQTFGGGEIGRLRYGLSGRGYIVFEPNYRGSDNLGNAYEHAIYRDPGTGPARDIMAGIAALEKTGAVDRSKIAIVGHSYGGYMTSWLIGHQHIWRCAVVADGVTDWRQEYDLAASGNLAWTRDSLGGTPMDPSSASLYVRGSPITYASQITTPTLILSGTADQTVPITESFTLYHALRDRHVPVRFVGIPGALHSPSKPLQIDRYYATILAWVVAHM